MRPKHRAVTGLHPATDSTLEAVAFACRALEGSDQSVDREESTKEFFDLNRALLLKSLEHAGLDFSSNWQHVFALTG